jgi:hypothetical protein
VNTDHIMRAYGTPPNHPSLPITTGEHISRCAELASWIEGYKCASIVDVGEWFEYLGGWTNTRPS